ncbi:hypothetical protein EJ05DRAFT_214179 [Pseudovirgaria hyperparasitica]|uniref:Uncharacterized protein n=1 Tax=Pseudovirgaria hyperparasitica TaxID=470096 RepID=A0A6A6VTD7_9PEZI|nr:uncharacterized protein EJ05DRAFT_214179 [Pseudovirgaria hyperparasitica]KAF2753415.1 hypothetical protein EJ05DRAFT_214179 [Pseudovirgaria hyperparasitica]
MLCNILLTFLISSIAIDAHVTRAEQWPSTNATEKCAISENDPDIWTKSNASAFLEAFLRKNGPVDWLHNMDLATTAGGSQGSSSLHCDQYPAQDVCPFPSLRCTDFTPPEVYFIRMAAASMYSFHALVGTLIDTLFGQEGLELDSIMQDLKPKEYKQPLALSIVNNLLFFIYAVKLDFPADTIFSLAMAAFGTARSLDMLNEKTSKEFPAAEIKHYLRQIWQEQNQDIRSAMSAIFKGIDVPQTPLDKLLPEEGNWNHDAQRIAMIFSSSNWIQDKATTSVRAEETVKIFGRNLQKAIVGQALSQYGMGIFVETHWKLNEKGEEPAVTDEAICHHYAEGRWMNVTTKHPRPGWPEYYNVCCNVYTHAFY